MGITRHIAAGSIGRRFGVALLLFAFQSIAYLPAAATALPLTPTPSVQQSVNSQQSAALTDTNDLLWFTPLSNKWTLLGAMNFAVSGTTGTGSQTCATSVDTVQDGVSWKGMAGYNGANGWTFTLPNTWKGQSVVMAPYYKNGGVLFSGWGCRDISGQLGTNATYPGRRTATNGSVYPFMWADTLGGIAQNGSFTWEHAFTNLDPGTTYKFQYLSLLASSFCSLEDITTTGISNGVSLSTKNLAVTNNAARTKGSQLVTSTVSGVTQYNIVRKGSGVNCNHIALSAIQVHASDLVPQISSFSVATGPRSGGTSTTITGNNLSDINSVTIGGNAAIIESTTESTVNIVTPSGTVGAANVVIGNGTDVTTMTGGYTYTNQVAPSLQLSLPGNPAAITYGDTNTIAAQVSTAGSVTFKSGGVAIASCSNVAAVAFVATCSWVASAANVNTRLTADFAPTDSVTYTNLSGAGAVIINVGKASATVVSSSPSVQYGDAIPTITSSVEGLLNSDAPAVVTGLSCSTTYTPTSAVGSVPTTSCSGGTATNYQLTYTSGLVTVNALAQSSLSLSSATFEYGSSLALDASGGSGTGGFSYSLTSAGSAGCTRSGSVVSASSTGTCSVTITRDASGNYLQKSQVFTITISPGDQSLLMLNDVRGSYGSPLALSTSGGSGTGAVTYAVVTAGTAACSIAANGTDVVAVAAGTCTVRATKAASVNHNVRSSTDALITFDKIAQPAALTLSDVTFSFGQTLALAASGGNGGGLVTYGLISAGTAGCSLSANVVSSTTGGTCSVSATRAESTNYLLQTRAFTVTISQANQSALSIGEVNGSFGVPLLMTSTGGSGVGAVSYVVTSTGSAGCSYFAGSITVSSIGTCTVLASKAADTSYLAKSSAITTLTFSQGVQSPLTLDDDGMLFGASLILNASGGSGEGALSYSISSMGTANCALNALVLTSLRVGTCSVTVNKASSTNYVSLSQVFTITVGVAPQTPLAVTTTTGTANTGITLSYSGGSGNGGISWSVLDQGTARCGLIGAMLLAISPGTCVVRLNKAADDNYLASSVTQMMTIAGEQVSSGSGQVVVPTVAVLATTTTTMTNTTTTEVKNNVNKKVEAKKSASTTDAPKITTTTAMKAPTTTVSSSTQVPLSQQVEKVAASEGVLLQGDVSVKALITREKNALVMRAGLFKAVIHGVDGKGNLIPLDANGDIRIPKGGSIAVEMGQYQFNSSVFVWMFSTPKSLGERLSDARGYISARIATPKKIETGLHRIAFVGKSPTGSDITFMVGLIVSNPAQLSTISKVLIAVPLTLAIGFACVLPPSLRRRRRRDLRKSN